VTDLGQARKLKLNFQVPVIQKAGLIHVNDVLLAYLAYFDPFIIPPEPGQHGCQIIAV
jgi:hypothetical protein